MYCRNGLNLIYESFREGRQSSLLVFSITVRESNEENVI